MSSGTGLIDLTRWSDVHDGTLFARAAALMVPRPTKFERITDPHIAIAYEFDAPPTSVACADEVIE